MINRQRFNSKIKLAVCLLTATVCLSSCSKIKELGNPVEAFEKKEDGSVVEIRSEEYYAELTKTAELQRRLDEIEADLAKNKEKDKENDGVTPLISPGDNSSDSGDKSGEGTENGDKPGEGSSENADKPGEGSTENSDKPGEGSSEKGNKPGEGGTGDPDDPTDPLANITKKATQTPTPSLTPTTAPEKPGTEYVDGYAVEAMNPVVMCAQRGVNVRSNPSTNGSVVGSLEMADVVTVVGRCKETGWYKIVLENGYGYVSGNYLSTNQVKAPTEAPKATATNTPTSAPAATNTPTKAPTNTPTNAPAVTQSAAGSYNVDMSFVKSVELYNEAVKLYESNKSVYNEVLEKTNEIREAAGESKLVLDDKLCIAATMRAIEMNKARTLSHTRPDGSAWPTVLVEMAYLPDNYMDNDAEWLSTYAFKWGENIAMGQTSVTEVVEAWKTSEKGHYKNMVDPDFNKIGVGFCKTGGVYFWVQEFANVW